MSTQQEKHTQQEKNREENCYRIFLLTIWQEDSETWRFQLEDPRSGERIGFAGLEPLVSGLQSVMDENQIPDKQPSLVDSAP